VADSKVIVGVDGSDSSKEALRWALDYARATGAGIEAVAAWEYPEDLGWAVVYPSDFDPEGESRRGLDALITEVAGDKPDVEIHQVVLEGHPAPVLVEASEQAALLVMGSRGHGEFAGMLIGSVSEYCVTHAHCPVLVIRH
jgi:nucleotide-binding universal stress UspA family protein